jgi:hypothetical protein
VLAVLAVLAFQVRRAMRRALTARDWVAVAAPVALGVLALHSVVDFDWSYPALLSGFGLTACLALAADDNGSQASRSRRTLGLACCAVVALAAWAAWSGGLDLNVPLGGQA